MEVKLWGGIYPSLVKNKAKLGQVALHKLLNPDMYSVEYGQFVDDFSFITTDFKYKFSVQGGSLAVENALKAAFDLQMPKKGLPSNFCDRNSDRLNVIHFKNAFHGRSGYTLSLTNTGETKTKWFPKFPWTRVDVPTCLAEEQAVLANIESVLREIWTAAIILEPIQGEGGDNDFTQLFLKALRVLATKYDALLIFDEVQTGIGLTNKMWCYQHFNVVPDILVFGKKVQTCGICATEKLDEVPDNVFKVSSRINSTFGGNLVDMVRFSIILDTINNENLLDNVKEVGSYFLAELNNLGLKNVRGRGLMIAFDLDDTNHRDQVMTKLRDHMLALKSGSKSIRFRPHLTFSKDDVNAAISFIKGAVS